MPARPAPVPVPAPGPVAVELRRIRLPLARPLASAHGVETERHIVLVAATGPDGTVGWGECAALGRPTYTGEWTAGAWAVLTEELAPAAVARRPSGVVGHPMATAALSTAVLDARLKAAGTSLAAELGVDGGRAVASTAVTGTGARVDELLASVAVDLAAGHRSVKVKIRPGWDVEPLHALRDAWPDLDLAADGNGAYTTADRAHLVGLDRFGLAYLEQPLPADDLVAAAALAERMATPIALDESLTSPGAVATALALGAADVVSIKPGRLGGIDRAAAVAVLAAERGVDAFVGGMLETGVGRAAALAVAALPGCSLPTDLGPSARYFSADLTPPFVLDGGGRLAVPSGPGIGVAPDLDRVDDVTVERCVVRASG